MRSLFLAVVFLAAQPAGSQTPVWKFQKTLDSLLAASAPKAGEPGFAVLVLERGNIIYEHAAGLSNLSTGEAVAPATMFNIGSVTKQFTAACILLLEEQGKLRRSDAVQKHIPELPDFGHEITLDHLISHTSGLHDYLEIMSLRNRFKNRRLAEAEFLGWLKKHPVTAFEPGTDFAYSNTGYMLLSIVVGRAAGMPTGAFMAEHIFRPLGMGRANFQSRETPGLPDGTVSYRFVADKKRYRKTGPFDNPLGATGVHCDLRELAKWEQNFTENHLGNGGPGLIQKMEAPYFLKNGNPAHYGAGLFLKPYRDVPVVEHSGGWNSFRVQCRRFPEQGISVFVAANNDRTSIFAICDAICDKLLDIKPLPQFGGPVTVDFLAKAWQLPGVYLSFNNRIRRVVFSDDTLKIQIPGATKSREIPLRFDAEKSRDTLLVFQDPAGDAVEFSFSAPGKPRGFFWAGGDYFRGRRFFEKLDETPTDVRLLAGKYRSPDFGQRIRIKRDRRTGGLKLKPVFFLGYRLEPLAGPVFKVRGEPLVLRFSPDGLVLGHDWVSNLRFRKL